MADEVKQPEFEDPADAVAGAGAEVDVVSVHDGEIEAMSDSINRTTSFPVDRVVAGLSPLRKLG